jgi:ribosomal protein L7Ae-like RNA K-turn-binding protein
VEFAPEVQRKLLGLIGLGARARNVVVGVERVRDAVRRGKVRIAFVAPDASANSRDKVLPLLEARRVRVVEALSAEALGQAVGKVSTVAVGVTDAALARGLRRLVEPDRRDVRNSSPRGTR